VLSAKWHNVLKSQERMVDRKRQALVDSVFPPQNLAYIKQTQKDIERIHVLYPKRGSYQASMEVKKRLLYQTPHMGGKKLTEMARRHSRHGTKNSFVSELESRLDRFIYRLNLVPSIFAARQQIGHKHIMVNGRIVNQCGRLLKPQDIVEPVPSARPLFKRLIRQRLKLNTFVFNGSSKDPRELKQEQKEEEPATKNGGLTSADFDLKKLREDVGELNAGRKLPPPLQLWRGSRFEQLLLTLLPALVTDHAMADELRRLRDRGELIVVASPDSQEPIVLGWRQSPTEQLKILMYLDRVRTRRLLLGLLALRSPDAGEAHINEEEQSATRSDSPVSSSD